VRFWAILVARYDGGLESRRVDSGGARPCGIRPVGVSDLHVAQPTASRLTLRDDGWAPRPLVEDVDPVTLPSVQDREGRDSVDPLCEQPDDIDFRLFAAVDLNTSEGARCCGRRRSSRSGYTSDAATCGRRAEVTVATAPARLNAELKHEPAERHASLLSRYGGQNARRRSSAAFQGVTVRWGRPSAVRAEKAARADPRSRVPPSADRCVSRVEDAVQTRVPARLGRIFFFVLLRREGSAHVAAAMRAIARGSA
jgi:hypothetical protein